MSPQREEATSSRESSLQEPLLSNSERSVEERNNTNDNDNSIGSIRKDIVLPACCSRRETRINYNVFLNLLLAVMYGISNSLWNGTAYAAYLKKLGRGNGPLGDIEAVMGLASLLAALPMGYVADKIGRSKVIRAGGLAMLVTVVAQVGVLEWVGTAEEDETPSSVNPNRKAALWMMGVIMALWGIGDGVVNGPCMALFADSTLEGQRTTYFNYLFVCYAVASACGPLVSIILFQVLGDVWDLYHLRIVIYVGLGMEVLNSILMTLFDDRKALDEDDQDDDDNADSHGMESESAADGGGEFNNAALPTHTPDLPPTEQSEQASASTTPTLTLLQKRQKWIPYLVFTQGLIMAVGSGMTVKFFPLFFKDEVGMTPSQVQIIYCIVPLVMSIASTLCTKLAGTGFGRVQAMLLYSFFGVSLMYSMVFFKSYLDLHPFLLVPIYVLRTSLMNASYPIQESILMDFVPKNERARWKSLDSVASFGWCGSAALGGWLADKFDYTYTFLITAILQSIGIAVWCCLLPLVPRTEGFHLIQEDHEEENDENTNDDDGCLAHGHSIRAEEHVAEMEERTAVVSSITLERELVESSRTADNRREDK